MKITLGIFLLVFFSTLSVNAQTPKTSTEDLRKLVDMPDQARAFMRRDMIEHLITLNQIIGHLSNNEFKQAAEIAETNMGKSAMGKHRGSGMGPGRFMPLKMRNIGWGMHEAASEFADIAQQGDRQKAYDALQKVTSLCVACHNSFRTQ